MEIKITELDKLDSGIFYDDDNVHCIKSHCLHSFKDRFQKIHETYEQFKWEDIAAISPEKPIINDWVYPQNKLFTGRQHQSPVIGYDLDWYELETDDGDPSGLKVSREKIYFYHYTYTEYGHQLRWANYWYNMMLWIEPIIEKLLVSFDIPSNVDIKRQLNLIRYACVDATDETLAQHRAVSSDRFGTDHVDETLFGLHLGESHPELHAKPHNEHEDHEDQSTYLKVNLDKGKILFLCGEWSSSIKKVKATNHRLFYNNDYSAPVRYSLILDLTYSVQDDEDKREHPMLQGERPKY